jgi:hypothetical protein
MNHPHASTAPRRTLIPGAAAWVLVLWLVSTSVAQTSQLGFASEPRIAIKGSDLVLPLVSRTLGAAWPKTVSVRVGNQRLRAAIVWLVPNWPRPLKWVSSDGPVAVTTEAIAPNQLLPGAPMLLVPIPWDASGTLAAFGGEWEVEWLDSLPPLKGEPLQAGINDHSPALDDPFEYFRWVLEAERRGQTPPPFQGTPHARRLAESHALRWRVALARTARASRGIADELRDRLLATATDDTRPNDDQRVAGWITAPRGLILLQSMLLQPSAINAKDVARAGLAWVEARPPFSAWYESVAGDQVVLAILNPSPAEVLIEAQWQGEDAPSGLLCPEHSISRHVLDRPSAALAAPSSSNEFLLLAAPRGGPIRLDAGAGSMPVRPPGALIGPMLLPLTLAAANGGYRDSPPIDESTLAILRRRFGRWEVFVECRRRNLDEVDRFLLQIGESKRLIALLEVSSKGVWRVRRGGEVPSLGVDVESFADRWRCRILLPEAWLVEAIEADSGGLIRLGIRRDGPGARRQFAGLTPPAWNSEISELGFDLGTWGDVIPVEMAHE